MKRNSFYPSPVGEQILWLTNFHTKLVLYAAVLGITNAQRDGAVADARWLIYVLGSFIPALRPYSKACTEFARAAQTGDDNGVPMVVPVFEPPPLPAADPAPGGLPAVVPRPPGALRRIFSLIQVMQELPTMTDAIETDLQIVGTAETPPDLATVQPVIKVMREGQFIFVDWGWGGLSEHLDLCQIQVDRGDGKGWVDLSFDPNPGYLDQTPHPAALTQWKYRAIYRVGTAQVGLWSAEASIVVGGGN